MTIKNRIRTVLLTCAQGTRQADQREAGFRPSSHESRLKLLAQTSISFAAVLVAASGANAQTINLNVFSTNEVPQADLAGPAGGEGEFWDQRSSVNETGLLDKFGVPTDVGYSFTVSGTMSGPWDWGDPDLRLIASGMANFFRGVDEPQQFVINGLTEGDTFDVWIASANTFFLFTDPPSNQRAKGEWSTPNVTTTVGSQTIDNTMNVNATTWEEGNNYVLFEDVVVDGNGELVFDGFSIDEIPTFDNRLPVNGFQLIDLDPTPPTTLTLQVNTLSGELSLLGHDTESFDINYYQITSRDGLSLDPDGWESLADQDGFPAADPPGSGNGWEEGGSLGSHMLAEGFLLGNSTIAVDASVSLGTAYDTSANAPDLKLQFRTAAGDILLGLVEYVTTPVFEADFDEDGDVDGDDFLLWQVGFGAGITSGATKIDGDYDNDGDVDGDDFLGWQAQFPSPGEGNGSGGAIPEPSSIMLLAAGAAGLGMWRKKRAG